MSTLLFGYVLPPRIFFSIQLDASDIKSTYYLWLDYNISPFTILNSKFKKQEKCLQKELCTAKKANWRCSSCESVTQK